MVGKAKWVDHVDQTQAECKPDGWVCPITLTDTLEGVLGETSTIKGCRVAISYAEVELHELDRGEDGGYDLWCHAKALTG